ncbi:hypothetical protein NF867_05335 [Solitalea sp. MAHUQ-68]|uniref:Uncharacterized protein n=1 Tax=Solitalea agri TaxID=2953739 RepID=A0A9X2JBA3_9SPHI|nr:hypothetical protein [Solitalea agri]MCO4292282.1 hypothetical protein [Solitalea agri]
MTKRLLIVCFTFFFLLMNAGVPVYAHYCGKVLTSTDFHLPKKCSCTKSGEEPMKDCCKDEAKVIKVQDDFLKSQHQLKIPVLSIHFALSYVAVFLHAPIEIEKASLSADTSPPDLPVERFILHHNFRI